MKLNIDPLTGLPTIATEPTVVHISSSSGGAGGVRSVTAGSNITVNNTDPANPIVSATSGGSGDVVGPTGAVDNSLARFDGTTGKIIQGYVSNEPTVTDSGQMFVGPPPILTSQGTIFNTNTTDLNSNVIINSFQATGSVNAAGNVQALQFNVTDTGANNIGTLTGVNGLALKSGSGSVTTLTGLQASVRISGTVTATSIIGLNSVMRVQTGTTATTVTNFSASAATVTGTITSQYGFRAVAQKITNVTTGYGFASDGVSDINYFLGSVGVGTSAPNASAIVEVVSTTKGVLPPRMTTVQKNAIATPAEGLMVYDLTLHKLCVYTGAAWETITST